jgi:hypothetical protein
MRQRKQYILANPKLRGFNRILGCAIRKLPFSHLLSHIPSAEPMVSVDSGRNGALLPLSIVKRIVATVPSSSFDRFEKAAGKVCLSSYAFREILEEIECENLPLRHRYAVIEAQCVGWAAAIFTFSGSVSLEADAETLELGHARGEENKFANSDARRGVENFAAMKTRKPTYASNPAYFLGYTSKPAHFLGVK